MKLSQSAAAAEIGVSVDAIQDYEQGRSRVPAYVPRLCRYYERFGALD
jgi:DNA-binding transcriptional regulator YiaG